MSAPDRIFARPSPVAHWGAGDWTPEKAFAADVAYVRADLSGLIKWARFGRALYDYWKEHECCDIDGMDVQEALESHGIVRPVPYQVAEHGEYLRDAWDYEEGDEILVLNDDTKAPLPTQPIPPRQPHDSTRMIRLSSGRIVRGVLVEACHSGECTVSWAGRRVTGVLIPAWELARIEGAA